MAVADLSLSREIRLRRSAFRLALLTIIYNILEGVVASYFGYSDESLALFGFGFDSFIEVISAVGIAHMVMRIRSHPEGDWDQFEKTALRVTGTAFYLLATGLTISGFYHFFTGRQPETAFWGVVISVISLIIMVALIYSKVNIGIELRSDAILADARCTRVCILMSVVLLISSGVYELWGFSWIDAMGALGLAVLSFREGKECFAKVSGGDPCLCGNPASGTPA